MLLNHNFKGALLSSQDHIAFLNQGAFPKAFFHSAEEIVSSFNLCIYLHRQSCLAQRINENILALQSNGLMMTWAKKFVDYSYLKEKTVSEPKVLVFEQLRGAYELLAIGLALSFFVFLLEVLSIRVRCLRKLLRKMWRQKSILNCCHNYELLIFPLRDK